ncbi:MAG: hypothetical protein AB8D78_10590 [Akkermansiaceae bacterium]
MKYTIQPTFSLFISIRPNRLETFVTFRQLDWRNGGESFFIQRGNEKVWRATRPPNNATGRKISGARVPPEA